MCLYGAILNLLAPKCFVEFLLKALMLFEVIQIYWKLIVKQFLPLQVVRQVLLIGWIFQVCLLILNDLRRCYLSTVSLGLGHYGDYSLYSCSTLFKLNETPFHLEHRLKWNFCREFLSFVLLNFGQVCWIYYVPF